MRPWSGHLPAAGSPRLRDRIARTAPGPLRTLHTGRDAIYLAVELAGSPAWCLGLVGAAAAAVPNALRTTLPDLQSVDPESARIVDGVLVLGDAPVRLTRLVDVRVPRLRRVLPAAVPDNPTRIAGLIGAGEGLTPYGDDVVCGWLALQRSARRATPEIDAAIRAAYPRTTLLSATLLECSILGEVLPEFAAFVLSLGTVDEPRRAAAVAGVGASSGRGLLAGARLALAGETVTA
ncbi:MAG: DUF2877 domain-containing protein [Nocardioides sp.]